MKQIIFTMIALIATLDISAQTIIQVYEYDDNGNIGNIPTYISSNKVKVVFSDAEPLSGITDGYEWVDLGLPSGTLWATCNVGAEKLEDYGDYYAWGEIMSKETYTWGTYKWGNGSPNTLNKYCINSSNGSVDNKTKLEPEDDVATVYWGINWCMPTLDQFKELSNSGYTTTEWTKQNGVNGCLITSKINGKTLFLPAAGFHLDDSLNYTGSYGYYWSRTLYTNYSYVAYYLDVMSSGIGCDFRSRTYGCTVRPVRVQK